MCKVIDCKQIACRFKMHSCKQSDHNFICLKVRVNCINSNFGCTLNLQRGDLMNHLKKLCSIRCCLFIRV